MNNFFEIFNTLTLFDLTFLSVFCLLFILRVIYLFMFTGRGLFQKKVNNNNIDTPISLVITVRNQEENIQNNLPNILSDKGVDFETVVVDDYSQDNSYMVLGLLNKKHERLKISILHEETRFSVKLAQNVALKAASNNWVLSVPISTSEFGPEWLSDFTNTMDSDKNIIIGFSRVKQSNGIFNLLYRIESYYQYLKSVGFVQNGIPFIYSEENIAFQKQKYFAMGGFGKKINEPYANLELILNSFISKKTTGIFFGNQSAIVKSEDIERNDYLDLLKKSFRIESHLSISKKSILVFEEVTRLLLIPYAAIVIVLFPELWIIVAMPLGLKILAHLFIIKITQNRLNEGKIFISSLVYDLIMPYFKLFYRWSFNRKNKDKRWRSKV